MGRNAAVWKAPTGARKSPPKCLGRCGRRVMYGDRCPSCASELRKRKRRKPR